MPVDIVADVTAACIDIDTVVPCGLIVYELIMNALEHAFPAAARPDDAEISVSLQFEDGAITLVVDNTGIGPLDGSVFVQIDMWLRQAGVVVRRFGHEVAW